MHNGEHTPRQDGDSKKLDQIENRQTDCKRCQQLDIATANVSSAKQNEQQDEQRGGATQRGKELLEVAQRKTHHSECGQQQADAVGYQPCCNVSYGNAYSLRRISRYGTTERNEFIKYSLGIGGALET